METKQEIITAAMQEFISEGYSGARLQTIADQTGATKAMIHYYFKTKEGLFQEVFRGICDELITNLFQPLEEKISLFSKIDAFIDKVLRRFSQEPNKSQFLVDALNKYPDLTVPLFRDYYKCNLTVLDEQLKQASQNYEIAPVDTHQLIGNIMALCVFSSTNHVFLKEVLGKTDETYPPFLEQRAGIIKDTVINWITG